MLVNELRLPRYNAELLYGNLRPYGHQIIVNDAINNYSEFCLFDPSPTGSGKTAAWAIPALNGRLGVVIAAYPTNALAQDQYRSILKTQGNWK